MNDYLEQDKEKLGYTKPQLLPSKSLLTAIKLGYDIKQETNVSNKPIILKEGESVITTINTGFEPQNKCSKPTPTIKLNCKIPKKKNPDSIIEDIETGFGCENKVFIECQKPKYKTHLCKENYLGEFKTESEKTLARNNLGVYSKEEIDKVVGKIIQENNNFITKKEVENIISNLDFVNSTLRSYANYQIPSDLFKL